jgi:hypothetical protein
MTRSLTIAATVATVAALSGAAPGVASANSLLGGYGGPGQGNQAILGSALLNGPSGGNGGGSGGGSSSGSSSGSTEATSIAAPTGQAAGPEHSSSAGAPKRLTGLTRRRTGAGRQASRETSNAYSASSNHEAARLASDDGATLSLPAKDVVYVLLILAALVFTGALTRSLAHAAGDVGSQSD